MQSRSVQRHERSLTRVEGVCQCGSPCPRSGLAPKRCGVANSVEGCGNRSDCTSMLFIACPIMHRACFSAFRSLTSTSCSRRVFTLSVLVHRCTQLHSMLDLDTGASCLQLPSSTPACLESDHCHVWQTDTHGHSHEAACFKCIYAKLLKPFWSADLDLQAILAAQQ